MKTLKEPGNRNIFMFSAPFTVHPDRSLPSDDQKLQFRNSWSHTEQSSNSAKSLPEERILLPLLGFESRIRSSVCDFSTYAGYWASVPYICFGPNLFFAFWNTTTQHVRSHPQANSLFQNGLYWILCQWIWKQSHSYSELSNVGKRISRVDEYFNNVKTLSPPQGKVKI